MRAILIPVKEFSRSKERLAPQFSEEQRTMLAAALCGDFFKVVSQVKGVERVYVVSKEYKALSLAKQLNWEIISEREQISESHSVDEASRYCQERGVSALLRLPIDIPLATATDIEAIFAAAEDPPCAVIVPSGDGTGTNALLRSPPTLFPSHFGPNSFVLHMQEAERAGARVKVIRNARIELDVDEPADLEAAAPLLSPGATQRWLKQSRQSVPRSAS